MFDICLTVLCTPSVEEGIQDLLLVTEPSPVFIRQAVAAHGVAFGALSQAEQVLGRADAIEIRILANQQQATQLEEKLRSAYGKSGLLIWRTPLVQSGGQS
ncbi:DUF3240 family protein [Achromobacter animicus]|mgnify:CR=1 FL=1|uniref:DUF3240 family protein n=1 Tax=Achromobacter animicus TaxID=1389935 RepID=UPI00244899BE|nr:DUF3240 family protein [Achromobacter animicus]MDH0682757.1 DUF3240 family protein [Achromobacter animicus]